VARIKPKNCVTKTIYFAVELDVSLLLSLVAPPPVIVSWPDLTARFRQDAIVFCILYVYFTHFNVAIYKFVLSVKSFGGI